MTPLDLVDTSPIVGAIAFTVLFVFLLVTWTKRITGRAAMLATLVTMAWFWTWHVWGITAPTLLLQHLTYASWIVFLLRIAGLTPANLFESTYRIQATLGAGTAVTVVVACATTLAPTASYLMWVADLILCVLGMIVVEQIARNTRRDYQWKLRLMDIGLGTIFVYGLILYADATLFRTLDHVLLGLQPVVTSLAVPLIMLASLRNRDHGLNINISRRFVFRTGVLLVSGGYLLALGVAGYLVRIFDARWGDVVAIMFSAIGLIAFFIVLGSSRARNYLRVVIAKNLYEYKHDYREEWSRVTRELSHADPDDNLGKRTIRALGDVVYAFGGGLWLLSDAQTFVPLAQLNTHWTAPIPASTTASLLAFFANRDWIIDVDEFERDPSAYPGLQLDDLSNIAPEARLIVPLTTEQTIHGIVILKAPHIQVALIWEDYDLLKVIGRQAAGFLALQQAEQRLRESGQLHAFHQLSAFVIHDLKTVTSQLSLILENTEKHRDNPAFIDDMVKTSENAVSRMNKLLSQLAEQKTANGAQTELVGAIRQCVSRHAKQEPSPSFSSMADHAWVNADEDRLISAIGHIVQNAIDATAADGSVSVEVASDRGWAVVEVTDTGPGMDADFIENRLFQPFQSTKGLTGMGIGVYQSREYIRSVGGDIAVDSAMQVGTTFKIRVPLAGDAS